MAVFCKRPTDTIQNLAVAITVKNLYSVFLQHNCCSCSQTLLCCLLVSSKAIFPRAGFFSILMLSERYSIKSSTKV